MTFHSPDEKTYFIGFWIITLCLFASTMCMEIQNSPTKGLEPVTILVKNQTISLTWQNNSPNEGRQHEYHKFCPRPISTHVFSENEYLEEDNYVDDKSFACKYSGLVQRISLSSGMDLYGIFINFRNHNIAELSTPQTHSDLKIEREEEASDFYKARRIDVNKLNQWFIELYKTYPDQARIHKHVMWSEFVSQADIQETFPSINSCTYKEYSFETTFRKSLVSSIIERNIIDAFKLTLVKAHLDRIDYLTPVPVVSPLDIQFQGYRTMKPACSVFILWKEIYEKYWSKVELLTRRFAKSTKGKIVVFTAVSGNLIFNANGNYFSVSYKNQIPFPINNIIWRLILSSEEPMLFVTINNPLYYTTYDPFQKINPVCPPESCKHSNLDFLNENSSKPFTFCCSIAVLKDLPSYKTMIEPEVEKMRRIYDEEYGDEKNRLPEVFPLVDHPIEINCHTTEEYKNKCEVFCLTINIYNIGNLFIRKNNFACKRQIASKYLLDNASQNRIQYVISIEGYPESRFIYSVYKMSHEFRLKYNYGFSTKGFTRGKIAQENIDWDEFTKVNLMEDFILKHKVWKNIHFKLAITIMNKASYIAWLEVEKAIESSVSKSKNEYEIEDRAWGITPVAWKSYFPNGSYLFYSKRVKFTEKSIEFTVVNVPQLSLLQTIQAPCISICKSSGWVFSSELVFCCSTTDSHVVSFERSTHILEWSPSPGYDPVVSFISEDKLRLKWHNAQMESPNVFDFCPPEYKEGEITIMRPDDYFFMTYQNEKLCKWPIYYNEFYGPNNTMSYGLYVQMNDKAITKGNELKNSDFTELVPFQGVTSIPGLPKNVWYIELFRILDYTQKQVYHYSILFESVTKDSSGTENRNSYQLLNCEVANLHLEKLIDKNNILKRFRDMFPDQKTQDIYIQHLMHYSYLSAILIAPPTDMTFMGHGSLTSNQCHHFIMWTHIYEKYWSKVEELSRSLTKRLKEKVSVYTGTFADLQFATETPTTFHLFSTDEVKVQSVPNEIWRLIHTDQGSIVFAVLNDIFYYTNNSPFYSRKNFICRDKCESFGFGYLNEDMMKPHVFCCDYKSIVEHDQYREIFSNIQIKKDLLRFSDVEFFFARINK